MTTVNAAEIENWNEAVGRTWALLHQRLDRQLEPIGRAAMARAQLKPGDDVLDIGCGCGPTTLAIAETVDPGEVLGVDISSLLLDLAAEAMEQHDEVENVGFLQADAQVYPFEAEGFDVVFSRFGVMFFEDPVAAFVNLRRALRPGGRLAFCCWRPAAQNPYLAMSMQIAWPLLGPLPFSDPTAPGPFAFADPDRTRGILADAGFTQIEVAPFDALTAGDSLEDTVVQALRMGPLGAALRTTGADDEMKRKVEDALQKGLEAHVQDGVVKLMAGAWIVSATNR